MSTAVAGAQGYAPTLVVGEGNPEAVKYRRLWELPEYRTVAPGESLVPLFLKQARPKPGAHVIDFGCGTGRGARALARLGGLRVSMIDFVTNCLDEDVRNLLTSEPETFTFLQADLEKPLSTIAQFGYCTDVMEHIPTVRVDAVLDHILQSAQHVFFSISTKEDVCGKLIDEPLHLSVLPYQWWLHKFNERGAVIHWSEKRATSCLFYVTAWADGFDIIESGTLNVEVQQVVDNVTHNIAHGWQQVSPHETNDLECMIIGGGPSLPAFEQDIKDKRAAGVKLITLNGAYNWSLEHGLIPSAQIIVDAREFNKRFTKPVVEGCKYLLASQCYPSVFDDLPQERTYLWHVGAPEVKEILTAHYDSWIGIPGGSSVLLRALPLMRMLGYTKFHLYGCDSCLLGDAHHAYAQHENDAGVPLPVTLTDGRIFYAHPWMIAQAQEFITLVARMGDIIDLEIYGDGLLRHILETGASLAHEDLNT